jgi:Tfp pilus assembly protein PilF
MNINKAIHSASEFYRQGNLEQAESLFKKILTKKPNNPDILNKLGELSCQLANYDLAVKYIRKAIQLRPADIAAAYGNLGYALLKKEQLDEAVACFHKALQINPNYPDAYYNLGLTLHTKKNIDEAITCYQKALRLNPDHALAHWNMSLALLLSGNFKDGWKEYEWGLNLDRISSYSNFQQPLWDGRNIRGLRILLYPEQGFGDTIQFIRYASLVAQRDAQVIVACPQELVALLHTVEGIHKIFACGEQLPNHDMRCPLLSLPFIFETELDNIPAKIPYITADPILVQKWRDKVHDDSAKLKTGLVWTGSPKHKNDHNRSILLEKFSPLTELADISFYSLQKGAASEQAKNPPKDMKFIDYTEEIIDFSDTAALMMNLDLIISVDTSVVHLAGAIGKPVWALLPFVPDWRWMLNREDSPWYPIMRLFRQPSLGDWESVIAEVKTELLKLLNNNRRCC